MDIQPKFDADMTVRSFAYAAKQLATSQASLTPSAQYERILAEAEKHRSALRLVQRDAFELAEQGLRKQTLTKAEFHQVCETAVQAVSQGLQAISRIAAQYAPQKLAA
ncbi:MAG TPA: hypothetical protein VEB70_02965 [Noviherbaspirillum sp.]|nr:hypothetical protein [Noviherbaspirillum sp.]